MNAVAMARLHAEPEQVVRPLLTQLARTWRSPVLSNIECVVNPRLSVSLGRYRPALRTIELNARLFQAAWRLRQEVLCHEAAHAEVSWRFGPSARPHGPEWRNLMRRVGFEPRTAIPVSQQTARPSGSKPPALARSRYEHRCPVCQFTRFARRPVARWRCAACVAAGLDGALQIRRLSVRVDRP
jgi:predicted SprT family Zn-dependent metalloprotease